MENKYVCTLEQSKELEALGMVRPSKNFWAVRTKTIYGGQVKETITLQQVPSFTLTCHSWPAYGWYDILEILPIEMQYEVSNPELWETLTTVPLLAAYVINHLKTAA